MNFNTTELVLLREVEKKQKHNNSCTLREAMKQEEKQVMLRASGKNCKRLMTQHCMAEMIRYSSLKSKYIEILN